MRVNEEHVVHPNESLRFLRFETVAFNRTLHRHRQLELTWIERGAGLRFLGDSVAPFEAQDLVLVGVDVPHSWISSRRSQTTLSAATVVQFPQELLEQLALPELRRARPIAAQAQRGLLISGACRTAVIRVLELMRDVDAFARLAGLVEILGLLCVHTNDLRPIATNPLRAERRPQSQNRADRVIAWMYKQMAASVRVADAARIAQVTPDSFSRFFRREVGRPFSLYINDIRCGEACLRLRQSTKPIGLVAQECGFTNISHFNRQFRRRFGIAPRAYRDSR
jgi:AraC-like DNA-binding protein